jgi:hypothetical protein
MIDLSLNEYNQLKLVGYSSLITATGCLIVAAIIMVIPNFVWTLILIILAMVLAILGFDYLEKAVKAKPIERTGIAEPPTYEPGELISASLRNGDTVNAWVEIHFFNPAQAHHVLPRIKASLVRTLNRYAPKRDVLGVDPYEEIDAIFQQALEPLKQELGLKAFSLQTVKVVTVKPAPPTTPRANGMGFTS